MPGMGAGQVDRLHRGMRGKTEGACRCINARERRRFQRGRRKKTIFSQGDTLGSHRAQRRFLFGCAAETRHRLTCTAGICGDTVPDHLTLLSHRPIRVALPLITQCERRRSRTLHPRNGLTPPSFAVEAETRSIQHAPNRPPHIGRRQEVSGSPMLQPVFCSELSRIGAAGIGAPFRTFQKFLVENHRATL